VPERVADAIQEIAHASRDDQQEKPLIHADPAHRRPRLLRNTHSVIAGAVILVVAVAAGCAVFLVLGIDALDRPALAPVRVAVAVVTALVIGALSDWLFRPTRTPRPWPPSLAKE
jgi:hypothetical protein